MKKKINFLFFLLFSFCLGNDLTIRDSYNNLFKNHNEHIHPTTHITNLIRKGTNGLTQNEKMNLSKLGLNTIDNSLEVVYPQNLDLIYETNHFRFHYTLNDTSIHKVENFNYVIEMGEVFEQVWLFFMDTLKYNAPFSDPNDINNLYNIYIENLPSYYFGITFTTNFDGILSNCSSFIKMRNSYQGSQFSNHSELDNIKVTAVHEFFHSIQFSYNCFEQLWLMESTAVWSEDKLYNNINDLYRYIYPWFSTYNYLPINSQSKMYGSFILFQYIDEHFGGSETIKNIWDYSNQNSSSNNDISFQAIDYALNLENITFDETFHKMSIANKILNSSVQNPFSYNEAEGYKTVTNGPSNKEDILFTKGNSYFIENQNTNNYTSLYYSLSFDNPIKISLIENSGKLFISAIIKHNELNKWTIRTGKEINIDPNINIDWVSLVISAVSANQNNCNFSLNIEDGFSEDFTLNAPFPNPSNQNKINFFLEVVQDQTISLTINDLLGRELWNRKEIFNKSNSDFISWDGKNNYGNKVSNGIYFLTAKGINMTQTYKIIFLKNLK